MTGCTKVWPGLDSLRATTLLAPYGFSPGVLASPSRTVEQLDEFALTFITLYFQVSWVSGQGNGTSIPRPIIG